MVSEKTSFTDDGRTDGQRMTDARATAFAEKMEKKSPSILDD